MTIAYEIDFNKLAQSIHADNVKAGWWTDIKTGESITPLEIEGVFTHRRNPGELLALVHSEISEAIEADLFEAMDSHLPMYHGVFVEIADAAIRILDIAGAYGFSFKGSPLLIKFRADEFDLFENDSSESLSDVNLWVSRAVEGFRKNKMDVVCRTLNRAVILLNDVYEWHYNNYYKPNFFEDVKPDFFQMIQLKREYNLQRADHKIENRLKDNGKKI